MVSCLLAVLWHYSTCCYDPETYSRWKRSQGRTRTGVLAGIDCTDAIHCPALLRIIHVLMSHHCMTCLCQPRHRMDDCAQQDIAPEPISVLPMSSSILFASLCKGCSPCQLEPAGHHSGKPQRQYFCTNHGIPVVAESDQHLGIIWHNAWATVYLQGSCSCGSSAAYLCYHDCQLMACIMLLTVSSGQNCMLHSSWAC